MCTILIIDLPHFSHQNSSLRGYVSPRNYRSRGVPARRRAEPSGALHFERVFHVPLSRPFAHAPLQLLFGPVGGSAHAAFALHMAEPSENTFINLFVHTLRHFAQLPYQCIRDFIHPPDTQKTYEVVHLYSSHPRPLLLLP